MDKRITIGLFVGSLAVTAVCFMLGLPFFFLFLFLPFFFLPKQREQRCPVCGVVVDGRANYCSVCGAKIEKEPTNKQ